MPLALCCPDTGAADDVKLKEQVVATSRHARVWRVFDRVVANVDANAVEGHPLGQFILFMCVRVDWAV